MMIGELAKDAGVTTKAVRYYESLGLLAPDRLANGYRDYTAHHVRVVRGRAEDLHGTETFDVVTSRAVAPLDRLLGWSMPLVAPTGSLAAMKGRSVHDEVAAAACLLTTWRCAEPEVLELGEGIVDPQTTVLRVSWADPSRIGWPLARGPQRSSRQRQKQRRAQREAQ